MKNIHTLLTDKPSRLKQNKITKKISLVNKGIDLTSYTPISIFITSDEEIKQGDWHLVWLRDKWEVLNYMPSIGYRKECLGKEVCKIILTTDQDLIADGVQAIDDEFLEWFVQNPSCEWIEVKEMKCTGQCWKFIESDYEDTCTNGCELKGNYKIIIPKEEPKQETLEAAAKKYSGLAYDRNDYEEKYYNQQGCTKYDAFIEGVQWQQERSYSEEDLEVAFFEGQFGKYSFNDWLKQFKKKDL